MVIGLFFEKRWFPLIPMTFLLAGLGFALGQVRAQDLPPNQTEAKPAEAEKLPEAEKPPEDEKLAEKEARDMIDAALRLVLSQRRVKLQEIVSKHPKTSSAAEASALLVQLKARDEQLASRKLEEALWSCVLYDQRWRRLKEIERHYPNTPAAGEAHRLFEQHLAQIPAMVITNAMDQKAELTVDVPYSQMHEVPLAPGQTQSVHSAFPMMVRVNVGDNEWSVYRTLPGLKYVVESTAGSPVLYHLP